jgi:hypothetical protein
VLIRNPPAKLSKRQAVLLRCPSASSVFRPSKAPEGGPWRAPRPRGAAARTRPRPRKDRIPRNAGNVKRKFPERGET